MSNGAVPEPEGSWTPGVPHGGQPAGARHGAAALPLEPPTPTAQARPAPAPSGLGSSLASHSQDHPIHGAREVGGWSLGPPPPDTPRAWEQEGSAGSPIRPGVHGGATP